MKQKKRKKHRYKFDGNPVSRTTILNGFHHVYPANILFERYIEEGRKEVVELYGLLPQLPSGGYDALKYEITVKVSPITYDGTRRLRKP